MTPLIIICCYLALLLALGLFAGGDALGAGDDCLFSLGCDIYPATFRGAFCR